MISHVSTGGRRIGFGAEDDGSLTTATAGATQQDEGNGRGQVGGRLCRRDPREA